MHRFAPVALATILAATAPAFLCAQTATPFTVPAASGDFTDPANLAGERPNPRNGRELPIDGGIGPDGKPDNALGLAQMLRKLNTRASLMLIVAHPDDEDGGMLAYYSRGLGARVGVLTLTRGEGGQNQATSDFDDALGLLRTQELLSADRYMGVDTQMFGTEVDFGFTKTKQEAFQKWNHQRVLYDAVRAVRIFRPLVIAAVFSGAVTDGHGQHQVSGEIAQEVFKAAGDPNVFPELTREGILPWQPLKVYARVPFSRVSAQGLYDYATGQTVPAEFTNYVTGQTFTTEPTADVTINEGTADPLLTTCATALRPVRIGQPLSNPISSWSSPQTSSSRSAAEGSASPSTAAGSCEPLSYVQFARIGLGLQRSQIGGGDRVSRPGRVDVGYHLYGSRVCAPGLPNPTPNLCTTSSPSALNHHETGWPTLSHSERVGYRAAREKTPSAHLTLTSFTTNTSDNSALTNQPNFFDGINISLEGLAASAPDKAALRQQLSVLSAGLTSAANHFDPHHPDAIAGELANSATQIDRILDSLGDSTSSPADENLRHELRVKRAQISEAIALALGLTLDATVNTGDSVAGIPIKIIVRTDERAPQPLSIQNAYAETAQGGRSNSIEEKRADRPLSADHSDQRTLTLAAAETFTPTRPYFYRDSIEDPVYQLRLPSLRNAPATPAAAIVWEDIDFRGLTLKIGRVAHAGDQPMQIIPVISVSASSTAIALPLQQDIACFGAKLLFSDDAKPTGKLLASSTPGWTVTPPEMPIRAGITFLETRPTSSATGPAKITLTARTTNGDHYTEGFRPVGYGTLPRTNYYTPATLRVVPVDLKLPPENKRRIAYLPGTGDDVPAALASIGLAPTILKVSDLTPDKLSHFDTVVLGVRTYNAHPDLHGAPTQALLDFARSGGNVVVQYQTPEFTAADAPYPLTTHNERVIDETAPVALLEPEASRYPEPSGSGLSATSKDKGLQPLGYALLNVPNKITPADFNNWIEERGHGFLDTWDPHYTALTETHDPGAPAEHILPQAPQRGGLITVQLGKGRWTYCAFALYRQLPEAVPGAFRLFVNLLNP